MPRALAMLLVALACPPAAQAQPVPGDITYLLDYVAASGCTFIRNGEAHDAADAADHLRLKYSRGKRHVDTAEQFIDRLATESSWSGEPYTVTCQGATEPSADWLHRALTEHRAAGSAP